MHCICSLQALMHGIENSKNDSGTIKTYGQILYFLNDYQQHYAPKQLNDDVARAYLIRRYQQGLDWQTVNSDYSAIQKFVQWNSKGSVIIAQIGTIDDERGKKEGGNTEKRIHTHLTELLCYTPFRKWHRFGILTRAAGTQ
jgi:site-specific recombinase XerC